MSDSDLLTVCRSGLAEMGIDCLDRQLNQLIDFIELVRRWNRVHNLTRVTEPVEMVYRHILDSATLVPYLRGDRIIDVGTGAGLPGIPLAILEPERVFDLVECSQKRVEFLKTVIRTLRLENVSVLACRVEEVSPLKPYTSVTTRAFAKIPKLLQLVSHLCDNQTRVLALKGEQGEHEAKSITNDFALERCVTTVVPGKNWQHTLLVIQKLARKDK